MGSHFAPPHAIIRRPAMQVYTPIGAIDLRAYGAGEGCASPTGEVGDMVGRAERVVGK